MDGGSKFSQIGRSFSRKILESGVDFLARHGRIHETATTTFWRDEMSRLKFSPANAKIEALSQVPELGRFLTNKRKVYSLDLLSGHSCPYAKECLSKVVSTETGLRIEDGPHTQFRCFSASQEATFPAVYRLRKHNLDLLKGRTREEMVSQISADIPKNAGIIRLHVGGDFFSRDYFLAWLEVVKSRPEILFYAYTKSLPFVIPHLEEIAQLPNFSITASYGGYRDELIERHNLRASIVVFSEKEANDANLEIDHDDSHAANPNSKKSFALVLHGIQPKGTEAAEALKTLKREKVKHSYSRKENAI
jgi:hypothetical protein